MADRQTINHFLARAAKDLERLRTEDPEDRRG